MLSMASISLLHLSVQETGSGEVSGTSCHHAGKVVQDLVGWGTTSRRRNVNTREGEEEVLRLQLAGEKNREITEPTIREWGTSQCDAEKF